MIFALQKTELEGTPTSAAQLPQLQLPESFPSQVAFTFAATVEEVAFTFAATVAIMVTAYLLTKLTQVE